MNLMNFGREQSENGSLNDMLRQVGINDVGTFVDQFRSKVKQEAAADGNVPTGSGQQPDLMSMGSSLLNQFGSGGKKAQSGGGGGGGGGDLIGGAMSAYKMFSGNKGSSGGQGQGQDASSGGAAGSADMINNAMKVYKMFSGDKGTSGGSGASGGGNIFDTIGSTYENAQKMQGLLKTLDKNGDGKITIDDIQLLLQGLGLGSVSTHLSKALFKAVDRNGNGELDLTDVMALAAIANKLNSRFGAGATQQSQSVPQN